MTLVLYGKISLVSNDKLLIAIPNGSKLVCVDEWINGRFLRDILPELFHEHQIHHSLHGNPVFTAPTLAPNEKANRGLKRQVRCGCVCMMEASDCAKIYDLSREATVCNVMVVRAWPPPFPLRLCQWLDNSYLDPQLARTEI
ncbi:unnamed protein product [Larinioides sclopetarius]|uniref:Uncharacterized protein n=1 Tax=Larinioides sclopetarius TaxID=280406 RepID=A0AAV2BLS3_9ARAC